MFRRVRGNQRILDVSTSYTPARPALRIHDGAFSTMDLTARHPRTGDCRPRSSSWPKPLRRPANSNATCSGK